MPRKKGEEKEINKSKSVTVKKNKNVGAFTNKCDHTLEGARAREIERVHFGVEMKKEEMNEKHYSR
jgi:hypothetical protein